MGQMKTITAASIGIKSGSRSIRESRDWIARLFSKINSILALSLLGTILLSSISWTIAYYIVRPPRVKISSTPANYGIEYENVAVTTVDGLKLDGWFLEGDNGATIIATHGYRGNRESMLYEAVVLNRRGYSVLITTSRGHDQSEAMHITFGSHEMKDLDAWFDYIMSRDDVQKDTVGIMGESMGGGMAILYAVRNPNIKAVVTISAFALTNETIEDFVFQYLPWRGRMTSSAAQSIANKAEIIADFQLADLDTAEVIGELSPRPILIIQPGNDAVIDSRNAFELFAAAEMPKRLIVIPNGEHCDSSDFIDRVANFFDDSLGNTDTLLVKHSN